MRRLVPLLLLAVAACQAPGPAPAADPGSRAGAAPEPLVGGATFGRSVEHRALRSRVLIDGTPGADLEVVLILSSIHGDEDAGTPLVERLGEHLLAHPELLAGRRVVLVADANPDGRAADRRGNANGVDLNRNFPAANWGARTGGQEPLSEPEAAALAELLLRERPDRVVSLHQPLSLIDHDGPGAAYAAAVAAAAGLPARRLGSRPGSLGSWVGLDLGIPILTVELPRGAEDWSDDELWRRFGAMMVTCVTWSPAAAPGD